MTSKPDPLTALLIASGGPTAFLMASIPPIMVYSWWMERLAPGLLDETFNTWRIYFKKPPLEL